MPLFYNPQRKCKIPILHRTAHPICGMTLLPGGASLSAGSQGKAEKEMCDGTSPFFLLSSHVQRKRHLSVGRFSSCPFPRPPPGPRPTASSPPLSLFPCATPLATKTPPEGQTLPGVFVRIPPRLTGPAYPTGAVFVRFACPGPPGTDRKRWPHQIPPCRRRRTSRCRCRWCARASSRR